jgi:hypothetical protein
VKPGTSREHRRCCHNLGGGPPLFSRSGMPPPSIIGYRAIHQASTASATMPTTAAMKIAVSIADIVQIAHPFLYQLARNKAGNSRLQIYSKVAVARSPHFPRAPEDPDDRAEGAGRLTTKH